MRLVATIACAVAALASAWAAAPRPLAVTIDDLPVAAGKLHTDPGERERITRALLDVLARHRIHAVAFVIWGNVKTDADRRLLEAWLAAGHELGNHTATHPDFARTPLDAYLADVETGRAGLAGFLAAHGKSGPRWFRFPYLGEGETLPKLEAMRAALDRTGQKNLVVTIDDQDWSLEDDWVKARGNADRQRDVAARYRALLQGAVRHYEELGDELFGREVPQVLLLHANEVGSAQWDSLFTWLEQTGHRFASADEVLRDPAFADPPPFVADYGGSHWDRIARTRAGDRAREEVRKLLAAQAEAWNRGDLEAFTSVYADDATFLSPSGTTHGRGEVLERYRKRYFDRAEMGTLSFDVQEIRLAAGTEFTRDGDAVPSRVHGASVIATWRIVRPGRPDASGPTLLVLRRTRDGWRIEQDASM